MVVDLPLVPVIATTGRSCCRQANSISPTIATPASSKTARQGGRRIDARAEHRQVEASRAASLAARRRTSIPSPRKAAAAASSFAADPESNRVTAAPSLQREPGGPGATGPESEHGDVFSGE